MGVTSMKIKKLHIIFIVYWFLLAYIIVALAFWFIELNNQNHLMTQYKLSLLKKDNPEYVQTLQYLQAAEKRKIAQYLGEGSTFLLLILAGAVFVFRAVRRQFRLSHQQQNFMMAITHELKTPIAVTKLNLETLQKRKLDESQQQRLIQNTLQEANRLNALCNNMLLASQMEAGGYRITKEEINIGELAKECVHDFVIRFPQRTITAIAADDLYIIGDKLLIQMGINNLIENAIKYSPKESPVIVEAKKESNFITVSVKDEGKGIADEEKKKVFDKFYRVSNKEAKGTGLGLYLTKKIAQQHRAHIFVTDNIPSGSNFSIQFKDNN
jgi:two-component system sensor histidine kinase CiaH